MSETAKVRYENAIALLRRIADGTVTIGLLQQPAPCCGPSSSQAGCLLRTPARLMA
ncbi:MAG: hypothetical protein AB1611_17920 [bacterium]